MKRNAVLTVLVLSAGASGSMAMQITLVGSHLNVVYDTANVGLFGAPILSGDNISWSPAASFEAKSSSQGGPTTKYSQTQITIIAHTNFALSTLAYSEGGTYYRVASGLVSASGAVDVAPFVPPALPIHVGFTTNALAATGGTTPMHWSVTVPTILLPALTTKVSFDVSDSLKAFGGITEIKKLNPLLLVTVVSTIPEPESYAMMISGLLALGLVFRRRRQD